MRILKQKEMVEFLKRNEDCCTKEQTDTKHVLLLGCCGSPIKLVHAILKQKKALVTYQFLHVFTR